MSYAPYVLINYSKQDVPITYFGCVRISLIKIMEKFKGNFKGKAYFFEIIDDKVYRLKNDTIPRGFKIYYLQCDDSMGAKSACKLGCIKQIDLPVEIQTNIKSFLVPV